MENNPIPNIDWQTIFSRLYEVTEGELDNTYKKSYHQGVMTATALQGFLQGFCDGISGNAPVNTDDTDVVNDTPPIPAQKTNIADCRACWCDTCKNIEYCEVAMMQDNFRDGIRRMPCKGCLNGMRFRPVEQEPDCNYDRTEGFNNG